LALALHVLVAALLGLARRLSSEVAWVGDPQSEPGGHGEVIVRHEVSLL
jgi:hypothetical protein